jgi:hypothetical protein
VSCGGEDWRGAARAGREEDRVGTGRVTFFSFSFSLRAATDTSGSSRFHQIGGTTSVPHLQGIFPSGE